MIHVVEQLKAGSFDGLAGGAQGKALNAIFRGFEKPNVSNTQ